ncbi:hypothetical protein STEG23_016475 [Scotinomys teguina]
MVTVHTPLSSSFSDHPQTTPKLENGPHGELDVPGMSSSELGSLLHRHLRLKPFESVPTDTKHAGLAALRLPRGPSGLRPQPPDPREGRPACSTLNSRSTPPPLHAPYPEHFLQDTGGRGLAVTRATVTLSTAHAQRESPGDQPVQLMRKGSPAFASSLNCPTGTVGFLLCSPQWPRSGTANEFRKSTFESTFCELLRKC